MKKLFVLLFGALSLTACNPVEGDLFVLQNFVHENEADPKLIEFCRRHPTDYWCRDVDTVNPTTEFKVGKYAAKLEVPSKDQLVLTIDNTAAGVKNVLKFNIPKSAKIPDTSGSFALTSKEVGQPYDIAGNVATQSQDSPLYRGSETCTRSEPYTVCHYDRRGHYTCHTEYRTVYGRRDVEYYTRTTTKNVTMNLVSPGTTTALARFAGASHTVDKYYTYQGACF